MILQLDYVNENCNAFCNTEICNVFAIITERNCKSFATRICNLFASTFCTNFASLLGLPEHLSPLPGPYHWTEMWGWGNLDLNSTGIHHFKRKPENIPEVIQSQEERKETARNRTSSSETEACLLMDYENFHQRRLHFNNKMYCFFHRVGRDLQLRESGLVSSDSANVIFQILHNTCRYKFKSL